MKMESLYTVIITPFAPNGDIDKEGFRKNLRRQLNAGVKGIVVLGTTGESPTLSADERQEIIEIAVDEMDGKGSLWVGTGTYSTKQTIDYTRQAQELGADGALIVTPYYNKPTQEGLFRHFAAICDAVNFPICIYNIQGRTGQNLETPTLQRLLAFSTIVGVKESSGNFTQITDVLDIAAKIGRDVRILSGDDAFTLPLMALGGHGVFSVVSNLIPQQVCRMVQAAQSGDYFQARNLHYQMLPFFKAAFIETNPIPIKAAMKLCGLPSGSCRLPLCDLSLASHQKLKEVIDSFPSSWLSDYG